ncbi:MAG TPA: ferritin-like domain-containing protein [Burkholderiaceae bacterium]|nr:ferritin-like domain-containing protein [Burkholderiaceae bacterium]
MNPATHRAQLVGMLAEAAEIEHCLMCTYLYAAFSLKTSTDEDLSRGELEAVQRWYREIIAIATDEMLHLALANNLAIAIGARPHYRRFNFPIAPGLFPADIAVELAPLDEGTLDHFVYLERPADVAERDGAAYAKTSYARHGIGTGRLMMMADDYATVGELYEAIATSCEGIAANLGEAQLFIGPRESQLGPRDFRLPGLMTIGSLADAHQAIEFIRHQGEGSRGAHAGSHYARFRAIRDEWAALQRARPGFVPARAAARNPVMREPVDPAARVHITAQPAADLLDAGNVCYEMMLRLLTALSDVVPRDAAAQARRRAIADQTLALMHTLADIGGLLSALPASAAHPGVNAGLTFTASRTVLAFLSAETATLVMAERFGCVAERLEQLAARLPSLARHAQTMRRFSDHWTDEHDRRWPGGVVPRPDAEPAKETSAMSSTSNPTPAAKPPDEARGRDVLLRFDTQRCIHARRCVLGEPEVFLANTPGEWLHPDAATPERIAIVAAQCPSGAVTYERLDGGANEQAPRVNVVRVRENGPLAVLAEMQIAGQEGRPGSTLRATLCRCGASSNKPFCDGSHTAAGFIASGEPKTIESQPLAARAGVLAITPTRNGPLEVKGNLEVCSGTGRTVDRVTETFLCRCGHSQNKPFCDGSHGRAGFVADGA